MIKIFFLPNKNADRNDCYWKNDASDWHFKRNCVYFHWMNRATAWFNSILEIRRPQLKVLYFSVVLKLPLNIFWMVVSFDGEGEVVIFWKRAFTAKRRIRKFCLWLFVASVNIHSRVQIQKLKRDSGRMTKALIGLIFAAFFCENDLIRKNETHP